MKNKEKKVIILENLSSPFIAQAIIILKDNMSTPTSNIIEEAEKLVSGYFPVNQKNTPTKNNRKLIFGGVSATITALLIFLCIRFLF